MKRTIVCVLCFFLVAQTAIAEPPESSASCSQPKIDATNSSVTVSVEPSTTQVRQTVTIPAQQGLVYSVPLTEGSALFARFQVVGGLNNQIKVMLLDLPNYQLYQQHQKYSYFQGTTGRRHIKIDQIKCIGKESNSLENVDEGLVHSGQNVIPSTLILNGANGLLGFSLR